MRCGFRSFGHNITPLEPLSVEQRGRYASWFHSDKYFIELITQFTYKWHSLVQWAIPWIIMHNMYAPKAAEQKMETLDARPARSPHLETNWSCPCVSYASCTRNCFSKLIIHDWPTTSAKCTDNRIKAYTVPIAISKYSTLPIHPFHTQIQCTLRRVCSVYACWFADCNANILSIN